MISLQNTTKSRKFFSNFLFLKTYFFLILYIIVTVIVISCGENYYNNPLDINTFAPTITSVAHRGYLKNKNIVENTAVAYRFAKQAGFQYGETDVQWTKDNIPVCCHFDYFYDQTTKDSISIRDYTLLELQTFSYYGTTISTLEEVMDTCKKYGLGLYLDRFTSFDDKKREIIFDLIDKFGKDKICYLFGSSQRNGVVQVLEYDSCATIGIVSFKQIEKSLVDYANSISTAHNKIIIDLDYGENPLDTIAKYKTILKENVFYGFFTINNYKSYKEYLPYAKSITSDRLSEIMVLK